MNQAVFLALLQPGDTFMGLDLAAGGHLTHGSPVNMSGKWFKAAHYTVRREDQIIDMDEVAKQAEQVKPKLIIAGGSAYSRSWDFKRFREIADSVGAYLLVEKALVRAAITSNKNGIPFDPEKPFVTSGLRLGTPAATTRGFGVAEFKQVGGMIAEVLNALAQSEDGKAPLAEAAIKERVKALTDKFPIYQ